MFAIFYLLGAALYALLWLAIGLISLMVWIFLSLASLAAAIASRSAPRPVAFRSPLCALPGSRAPHLHVTSRPRLRRQASPAGAMAAAELPPIPCRYTWKSWSRCCASLSPSGYQISGCPGCGTYPAIW